jgi:hypothetical protein
MKTTLKPCLALKPYIDYWDEWHKEWSINTSSKPPKLTPIKCWPIPAGNGGNKNDILRYFPEAYWGNPNPIELTAVFLNLNPGGGGDDQDIKISAKEPIATYNKKHHVYSDTVNILINNPCYPTTDWFIKKRVHWLNCLLFHLKTGYDKTIRNIIAGELVPWHTKNVNEIKKYINANINLIETHCIKPLAKISQCATLGGVVFCRGVEIVHALKGVANEIVCYTSTSKLRIHIFELHDAIFIIFVGGRNMDLPNPSNRYNSPINKKLVFLYEIVNGCVTKSYV